MDFFDDITARIVSFPVNAYDEHKTNIIKFFEDDYLFQLSILLSSRSLFEDVKKGKSDKVEHSLNKYFSRACFKPTPFGTFSSVSILNWGKNTKLTKSNEIKVDVRYDNLFIYHSTRKIKGKGLFEFVCFSNPSIYFLNDEKIGYYKSVVDENGAIDTSFVELDYDENIEWLINRFKGGVKVLDVFNELLFEGFDENELEDFLIKIIDESLIVIEYLFYPYSNVSFQSDRLHSELISSSPNDLSTNEQYEKIINQFVKEQDFFLKEVDDSKIKFTHSVVSYESNVGEVDVNIKEKILKYINFNKKFNTDFKPISEKLASFGNKFIIILMMVLLH
ncbi:lantibiotic dehydratase [Flavobacterium sp.]|uniref:lantibiotic dehydratase n=1 Tax=Flavobacterium sp. TaxID=239 RepID=UPI004047838D